MSALAGVVFAGLFSGTVFVFATPPTSQYSPGETLNPSCAVGSTNCSTVSPVPYSGATAAVDLGSQNFTTTGTSALGASTSLKYNSTNYTTLTTASNGDLTIATTSATTGGNINISSAVTGDFTLLSNSGTLVLGGTGNSNNENLKLDFETYANKVAVTSGTGVTDIDFGSLNLATTGTLTLGGSTAGTLVTRVKAGAATESDTNGSLVVDSTNGRLYFRYGGAWHYVAQTAGFQIPDFETIDPLSGDQIKEGDLVLGTINQTFEDGALHGVWVKWDSVKQELIKELKGQAGATSPSDLAALDSALNAPVTVETLLGKVTNALFSLGISIKDGVTTIANLTVQRFSAKTARVERLEMVDKATGEAYCTWIENGEWMKAKGECGSVAVAQAPVRQLQQQAIEAQKIVEEVKQDLTPQIKSQVQTKVREEVQNQMQAQEPLPPLPEPQPEQAPADSSQQADQGVIQPQQDVAPSASIDSLVQDTAAAFMDNATGFTRWLLAQIIPSPGLITETSAALSDAVRIAPSAIAMNAQNNTKILSGVASNVGELLKQFWPVK